MKGTSLLTQEENRRDAYKLLSAFYHLPERETLGTLAELEAAMGGVCTEAAAHVSKMWRETHIEQLRKDYSQLFVGPFKLLAPPYGSVYLDDTRRVMGDSTLDARARYREAGLSISGFKEAPDHIAIELEFMYYLVFKEIEAIMNSDFESAVGFLKRQKSFLQDHLGAWVPEFAGAVEKNAGTGFFASLAIATKAFVQKDLDVLEESVAELSAVMGTDQGDRS